MKLVALKELPHGQQPGDLFEENDAIGNVLILALAARKATEDDLASERPRRGYRRRDMRAQSKK